MDLRVLRFCTISLCTVLLCRIIGTAATANFQSVHISYFARVLYERLRNEAAPDVVHEPAIWDTELRARICRDITSNGVFAQIQVSPCNLKDLHHDEMPSSTRLQKFWRRQFQLMEPPLSHPFHEYVFECLVKHSSSSAHIHYYVSKEYNVAASTTYKRGRFVFGNFVPIANGGHHFADKYYVMLAEEPIHPVIRPYFNIEIHYLAMRKYIQPIPGDRVANTDPLCRLLSANIFDGENQYTRLCMAACTVFHFRYALDEMYYPCVRRQLSFKTAEGIRASAGESFFEYMSICRCAHIYNVVRIYEVYISRSYRSGEILWYHDVNGATYLKGLCRNVDIMDEINSFDFVED